MLSLSYRLCRVLYGITAASFRILVQDLVVEIWRVETGMEVPLARTIETLWYCATSAPAISYLP